MLTNNGDSFSAVDLLLSLVGDHNTDEKYDDDDSLSESVSDYEDDVDDIAEDEENVENTPQEVFETPPEGSSSLADARFDIAPDYHYVSNEEKDCTDEISTVDLENDTERIDEESQSEESRVIKRQLDESPNEGMSKRLKGTEESESVCGERSRDSVEKLNFKGIDLCDSPIVIEKSTTEEIIIGSEDEDSEVSSSAQRKLELSTQELDIETSIEELGNVGEEVNENCIDELVYAGSAVIVNKSCRKHDEMDCDYMELTLLDVLEMLSKKENDEDYKCAKGCSILDIAIQQGMTFPQPSWWQRR